MRLEGVEAFIGLYELGQNPDDPVHQVGQAALSILKTHPDAVSLLAHEKLHAFHFDSVPVCWRRLYEEATLWKVVSMIKSSEDGWLDEAIKCLDMALILTGAPARRILIDSILESFASLAKQEDAADQPPRKRQRIIHNVETPHYINGTEANFIAFSRSKAVEAPVVLNPVSRVRQPSLHVFQKHAQQQCTPIILTHCLENWPALKTWRSPQHWLDCTLGGRRLVPVELGRSYTDDGWAQKIIPFAQFLETHLLAQTDNDGVSSAAPNLTKGYLAQHDLLTQIPKLRSEIMIPDYCFVDLPNPGQEKTKANDHSSDDEDSDANMDQPLLNIWLGPAGTISPCHTDPHHNILAQVIGRKYVRLFSPSESPKLYPMDGGKGEVESTDVDTNDVDNLVDQQKQSINMSNTSRIDISRFLKYNEHRQEADENDRQSILRQFPRFTTAEFVDCILEPGECLYIPRGWWHFITSLDVSASVSFWWD